MAHAYGIWTTKSAALRRASRLTSRSSTCDPLISMVTATSSPRWFWALVQPTWRQWSLGATSSNRTASSWESISAKRANSCWRAVSGCALVKPQPSTPEQSSTSQKQEGDSHVISAHNRTGSWCIRECRLLEQTYPPPAGEGVLRDGVKLPVEYVG